MPSAREKRSPLHVAIIMDGNGRWATRRGQPRTLGHRAGVQTVRRIVEAAPNLGVGTLSLFAFSSDNWRRPAQEVSALMGLLGTYIGSETRQLADTGVRVSFIGRRDRLADVLAHQIEVLEQATAGGRNLHVRIALDYSSRDAILRAARALEAKAANQDAFGRLIAAPTAHAPDVDLLIRTGGEKRLSDFLLWESAYAELWFTDTMWPDFEPHDLADAINDFRQRDRRFGALSQVA
jgi:undecaprenyl diphosphate synthase